MASAARREYLACAGGTVAPLGANASTAPGDNTPRRFYGVVKADVAVIGAGSKVNAGLQAEGNDKHERRNGGRAAGRERRRIMRMVCRSNGHARVEVYAQRKAFVTPPMFEMTAARAVHPVEMLAQAL